MAVLKQITGKTRKERKRRIQLLWQAISWFFVAIVVLIVVLLVAQFISRTWLKPPVSSEHERTDMLVRKGEHIQLTVLNGTGESNIARKFTDYLRARKFDVVEMTNYKQSDVQQTFIVDKVGDSTAAQKVAYALGVSESRIVVEVDTNAFVDDWIVVGKDYPALKPMK